MPNRPRRRRLALACLVAPLAAPAAAWVLSLAAFFLSGERRAAAAGTNSPMSLVFFGFLLLVYAAPLAYGATALVALPAYLVLQRLGWRAWWGLTAVTAAGGLAVLPLYLHLLEPRGWIHFPFGMGAVTGAAVGAVFWRIATTGEPPAAR